MGGGPTTRDGGAPYGSLCNTGVGACRRGRGGSLGPVVVIAIVIAVVVVVVGLLLLLSLLKLERVDRRGESEGAGRVGACRLGLGGVTVGACRDGGALYMFSSFSSARNFC